MANNGKYGEYLFKQIMESRNYKVEDVSNNPDFWYRDIDFIITSPTSGLTKTFEVKWDSRINRTGNLYLEISSINSKGGKGWWQFCEADYLAYGDAVAQTFHIIPVAELREKLKTINCRCANCGYESTGWLVKLADIADITYEL